MIERGLLTLAIDPQGRYNAALRSELLPYRSGTPKPSNGKTRTWLEAAAQVAQLQFDQTLDAHRSMHGPGLSIDRRGCNRARGARKWAVLAFPFVGKRELATESSVHSLTHANFAGFIDAAAFGLSLRPTARGDRNDGGSFPRTHPYSRNDNKRPFQTGGLVRDSHAFCDARFSFRELKPLITRGASFAKTTKFAPRLAASTQRILKHFLTAD